MQVKPAFSDRAVDIGAPGVSHVLCSIMNTSPFFRSVLPFDRNATRLTRINKTNSIKPILLQKIKRDLPLKAYINLSRTQTKIYLKTWNFT